MIWTNNQVTTDNTYLMAQVLIIGSTLNALMVLPYQLIIAYGWTKFSFYQNVIAAVILVPMLFIWTNYYGAFGATFVWLSVNAGYVFISQPLMHRKLLKHELAEWYWHDSLLPMLPSLLMILFFKYSLPYLVPGFQVNLFTIICITLVTLTFSLLFMPDIRLLLRKMYSKLNLNGLRTK